MSAIRLHRAEGLGIEIRVDDETLQGDEPISMQFDSPPCFIGAPMHDGHVGNFYAHRSLTIADAEKVRDALTRAIDDAKMWRQEEVDSGLRR
jgi:hypothetical protein